MRTRRGGRWLGLMAGLLGVAGAVGGLQRWSDALPGPAGDVYRSSAARDLAVYSYVYTDVGDPVEFLDHENGRYGSVARATTARADTVRADTVRAAAAPADSARAP
ncbi:MAG: hypothetical protein ACOC3J_01770 [Gemmatimonadota bacterium]